MMQNCPRCQGTGTVKTNYLVMLRRRAKLNQAQVAEKLGIGQPAYARLEMRAPALRFWSKHVKDLAALFKVTEGQLIGDDPMPVPKVRHKVRRPSAPLTVRQRGAVGLGKRSRGKS